MAEQVSDEDADRELAEAEKAFAEESGNDIVDIAEPKKEETAKRYQDILIALGFARYDNKEKGISCKLKAGPLQIGRTFTENYPIGNMWVQCLKDSEHGKKGEFLKGDECKKIPQVNLFYRIRNGELPIPKPIVTGKVVGKSEKAVQIQFDEFGQTETQWWGFRALKKDEGVVFVPASYSKETENYTAKMQVPRDIILKDYEAELKDAPLTTQTDTTKEKDASTEKKEAPTDNSTLADAIHNEPVTLAEGEKPTVDYYVNLIGEITEKVRVEERISEREHGYAINMVFNAITRDTRTALIAELKNGGNEEK